MKLEGRSLRSTIKGLLHGVLKVGIARRKVEVLRIFWHDPSAYTQGLSFHDGLLYESTGLEGRSSLRCVDPRTGTVLKHVSVPGVWAEGIAIRDGRLIQLTLRHQKAIIYSLGDLARVGEVQYQGEGWGLTETESGYLMSNGTATLLFRDTSFTVTRTLTVTMHSVPMRGLNDLSYAEGRIYANVWYTSDIVEICPSSGRVVGILDCSPLVELADPGNPHHILNGITYNPTSHAFYLTGKHWSRMFEVRVSG